ncbi:MAG: arginase [Acidobacteria bacterium]|nr:arginase [Acidobacteriota bacterium]
MRERIDIIGVPMDLGAGRRGVDMGPSAVRIAGLTEQIRELGPRVRDLGDVEVPIPEILETGESKARYLSEISTVCADVYARVSRSLAESCMPIVIGGDHSLAVGSVAGTSAAARAAGVPLGLIWVDAHADMNSPETSPSGNVHGMPLAACLGKGPSELVEIGGAEPSVAPERTVLLGVRNLDEVEKQVVRDSGVHVFTMLEIDQRGLYEVVKEALELASADGAWLHLSFDLDSMDPQVAPGVGTPVQGGLSYREAHLVMETMSESEALRTVDLVEVNPVLDAANATAKLATELALSAVGKRIL